MKALAALVALAAALAAPAATQRDTQITLESTITSFMHRHGIAGGVVAAGPAQSAPALLAFGHRDRAGRMPMRTALRFRLASLSKPITAAAVMALADAGRLRLGEALVDIAPELATAPDARYRDITVEQLLQHSGGWDRRTTFDPMLEPARLAGGAAAVDDCAPLALAMLELPLQFAPGSRQAYSNLGYCWLQIVIERRSGLRYEQFVRTAVLEPLGLGDVTLSDTTGSTVTEPLGSTDDSGVLKRLGPAGGWVAAAADYFTFASRPRDARLEAAPDGSTGLSQYYGLGWRVIPSPRGNILAHAGFLPGSFAAVIRFPSDFVIVALFNGGVSDGLAAFDELLTGILASGVARAGASAPGRQDG